jgi:hypothetical protein
MSEKSPTPDLLPRFNRACHLDKTEHGTIGHDMAGVIKGATDIARSPAGPKDRNDSASHAMTTNCEPGLGAGGGNLSDAARSIKSGARAPKADTAFLRKG